VPNRAQPSLISKVQSFLKLEPRWFRRTASAVAVLSVAGLLIAAGFTEKVSSEAGLGVASTAILFLLAVMVDNLVELRTERGVEVLVNESDATEIQTDCVTIQRPEWVKMCEYSAFSVGQIFNAIAGSGSVRQVKLLVSHPCSMPAWHREQRLVPAIASLGVTFPVGDLKSLDLQIRCYRSAPSLRGRNYGGALIAAGWYTRDRREPEEHWPDKEQQLWGASNPLVLAAAGEAVGAKLTKWFDEVFERVWETATPIEEALLYFGHVTSLEWLALASTDGTLKQAGKPVYELEQDYSRYLLRIRGASDVELVEPEDGVLMINGKWAAGDVSAGSGDGVDGTFTRRLSLPGGVKVEAPVSHDGDVEITLRKQVAG
jgi:hypothetical protein